MTDQGTTEAPSVGRTLTTAVTGLDHLIKDVDDRGLEPLDDLGLIEFMQTFEQLRNRLSVVDHHIIVDGQRRDLPDRLGQGTMRRVLTSTLSLSKAEAGRRVRAAEAVGPRTSMLGETLEPARPRLAAAQREGQVSPEKVAIITRGLGQVDRRGSTRLIWTAGRNCWSSRRRCCRRRICGSSPIGLSTPSTLTAPCPKTSSTRTGAMWSSINAATDPGPAPCGSPVPWAANSKPSSDPSRNPGSTLVTGPDGRLIEEPDPRHHGQRMHDALEDVCDRLLRSDTTLPDSGGTPATVIITIDLEDLLNGTGYGITSDGTLIRTEQVRTMTDQAEVFYAFLDRNGVPLNLGRTRRIASRGQSAALYARDGGCSFPGCDRAPEWCERHHVIPWIDGGLTDLNNLTLLCIYHHHNFLSRGWTCRDQPRRPPRMDPAPLGRP